MEKTKKMTIEGNPTHSALGYTSFPGRKRILKNLSLAFGGTFSTQKAILVEPSVTASFSVPELLPGISILRPDVYITPDGILKTDAAQDVMLVILPQEIKPGTTVPNSLAQSGVQELWLIVPLHQTVTVYKLHETQYTLCGTFFGPEIIQSPLLGECMLTAETLFNTEEEGTLLREPVLEYGQLDLNGTYTYWNYLQWQFQERVELIRGKIFKMSPPAPSTNHQATSRNLTGAFLDAFKNQPCQFFYAPFDVRLPVANAQKDSTVVQPDLCVVCDSDKLDLRGCNGAPDLVVEILSPGNSRYDMDTKFNVYQQSGIKEYWIVNFERRSVLLYTLKESTYIGLHPFTEGHVVQSVLFPTLQVPVSAIFEQVK